ncbi:MAG TPA: acyl-CoA thioesterase [Gemmatimonadota bacterium]|nr:acyl-CoA thioesterase [Gemmatimonadota bacterium]
MSPPEKRPDAGPGPADAPQPSEVPELPTIVGRSDTDEARSVSASRVAMTQLMGPQEGNLMGSVFGGVILAAVDKIAYVCASRHAGHPCVTVSVDQVDFRSPIRIGEIVTLRASVNTVGRTSVEVGVQVVAESVEGGEERHTNSCYVTMVALGDDGEPIQVPRLRIETVEEWRRHHDAVERRRARLTLAERRRERRREE